MSETILEVQHLGKSFGNNEILKDIDFSVKPKDVTCIIGPSGSGKSTLMNIIGCLDKPTSGSFYLDGKDILKYKDNALSTVRLNTIGFVFQSFFLMNTKAKAKGDCRAGAKACRTRRSYEL